MIGNEMMPISMESYNETALPQKVHQRRVEGLFVEIGERKSILFLSEADDYWRIYPIKMDRVTYVEVMDFEVQLRFAKKPTNENQGILDPHYRYQVAERLKGKWIRWWSRKVKFQWMKETAHGCINNMEHLNGQGRVKIAPHT